MIKAAAWSLLGGSFLTAGLAYVYARRAQLRRLRSEPEPAPLEASGGGFTLPLIEEDSLLADDEIDIEIVDIDTLAEEEEPYDATSPDELGALWLARATQTSGVHPSVANQGAALEDLDDELDPAGRPTDPPEEIEVNER
ncbi:MAG TPA: hypothetical protein VG937_31905 [Polyangiaceae bacterium]|jgi:hypothetical protein|nr:hypothetical protein [Polyangiaceae bacterium]